MSEDIMGRADLGLDRLAERLEQFWRSLARHPLVAMSGEGAWHPLLDVYHTDQEVIVEVELPGMKGQKMDVSLDEDHLIIQGTRERRPSAKAGREVYSERPFGPFHRIVHLPCRVDAEATSAEYEDGVLRVTLRKATKERGRKIKIR